MPPLDLTLFGKKVERTKGIDGMYPHRIEANPRDIRCLQGFFKDKDMIRHVLLKDDISSLFSEEFLDAKFWWGFQRMNMDEPG